MPATVRYALYAVDRNTPTSKYTIYTYQHQNK